MKIQEAFILFETEIPEQQSALQRVSVALRRGGLDTMEELTAIYKSDPEKIKDLRDIGPKRIALIEDILKLYEIRGPGPPQI